MTGDFVAARAPWPPVVAEPRSVSRPGFAGCPYAGDRERDESIAIEKRRFSRAKKDAAHQVLPHVIRTGALGLQRTWLPGRRTCDVLTSVCAGHTQPNPRCPGMIASRPMR